MKTIINNLENEIVIKKSKFIGKIFKINSENDIKDILNKEAKLHPQATHICYAYILNDKKKYTDDKEPSGTAGLPILNILEKNHMNHVLAVVIRYFGGIKLGSSNLSHAYQNAIINLIDNNIKPLQYGSLIILTINYSQLKEIEYLLKNTIIVDKNYQDIITLEIIIDNQDLAKLSNYTYKIIKNDIIL